ncbi:MAG: type I-C CRISPR-associated protein Cas5c [Methylobacter sp.]|uniref:type I-C CRISPR-associated protein Cas5c n=1 Tax=Methylobacter sp. TaxID=2051955 RepID=UPI002589DE8F|nr:type I-C CRISPR-associated protein Cas5c [Methylobacter sp.]MCL7419497.1 type I-C CRISPR-associated protein Cas5c [Methylobacter sp.]
MRTFCLEVGGPFACFTRPEMKVERVSYDVITPSAARAVFEAILWKPAIRWQIRKIEVLKPIRWINLRRNEVASIISGSKVKTAMNKGSGDLGIFIEEERQQRAGLFLRDVCYRLHADFDMLDNTPANNPVKFSEMFRRRAEKGQCFNQPYLGTREFAADFKLIDKNEPLIQALEETRELGWMLYDMDFSDPDNPTPRFFQARMHSGVIDIPDWYSDEVKG